MWDSEGAKSRLQRGWGRTVCLIVAISSFVLREVYGLAMSCRRTTWFIAVFGRTHKIRCFKFFYGCTYRSELIVALLKIPVTRLLHCTVPESVTGRPLQGPVFNILFTASIWRIQRPSELRSMMSSLYALLRCLRFSLGLELSALSA